MFGCCCDAALSRDELVTVVWVGGDEVERSRFGVDGGGGRVAWLGGTGVGKGGIVGSAALLGAS